MRLFHETQFASKKVIQRHELGIALDEFVYSLLRRQTDAKRKAVRTPSPTLHGTHDSVAAAGDQMKPCLTISHAKSVASLQLGESSALRADPKTATFRKCLNGAKIFTAERISLAEQLISLRSATVISSRAILSAVNHFLDQRRRFLRTPNPEPVV